MLETLSFSFFFTLINLDFAILFFVSITIYISNSENTKNVKEIVDRILQYIMHTSYA